MFNFFHRSPSTGGDLFIHTDIHCHLVPGIDDGQKEAEPASQLVERQREWGFRRVFTTPHVTQDTFENTPEIIDGAFKKLKEAVERRGTDISLAYSAEYRIDNFFQEQLLKGTVIPFPNNYLLVENSFVQESWNLDQMLFDLKLRGFKPIMAHPERYSYYFSKRERYKELKDAGTMFQVNLLSLAGYYGKEVKKVAEQLVENDWVDFLGSDMHHEKHADAIGRYLASKEFQKLAKKLDGRIRNDSAF